MFLNKRKGSKYQNFLNEIENLKKENLFLTDTHSHIHFSHFEDINLLLMNMKENAVKRTITIGIDYKDSLNAFNLANKYDNIYASIGVHPHDSKDFTYSQIADFEILLSNKKVIAVGEIGLDYYRNHSPKEIQKDVFLTFLDMAISNNLPVIIHNREATKDCISVMNSIDFKLDNVGIIHCFNGDKTMLKWALDKGFMISYAGPVTYSKADELRETLKYVPLDRLLIETDCPYLSPSPVRGKQNEPAFVVFTAYTICSIKEIRIKQLALQLEQNFISLFNI
jgi:TatD DNase family protein